MYNCKILFQLILILFLSIVLKIKSILIELKDFMLEFHEKIRDFFPLPKKKLKSLKLVFDKMSNEFGNVFKYTNKF